MEVYVNDMLVKSRKVANHVGDLAEAFGVLRRNDMKLNPANCVFSVSSGKFLGFIIHQREIEENPDKIRAVLDMKAPISWKQVQSLNGKIAALNRFVSRSTDKCLPFFEVLKKTTTFLWNEEADKDLVDANSGPPGIAIRN